jgi:hypothetical protein
MSGRTEKTGALACLQEPLRHNVEVYVSQPVAIIAVEDLLSFQIFAYRPKPLPDVPPDASVD